MIRILLQLEDSFFIQAFSNYASTNCTNMEFVSFTSQEKALAFCQSTTLRFDAVLGPAELLAKVPLPQAVRLRAAESTSFAPTDSMCINIYQSGPAILADIRNALALAGNQALSHEVGRSVRVVATYSAQGGSGKTTISYALAVAAARRGKQAIYLNLEPFPACSVLYEDHASHSLDDLLFALKSGRDPAPVVMNTMERNADGVLVMPPFAQAGDLLSLTEENVQALMEALMDMVNADYLFVDLPTGLQTANLWVLEHSDSVLLVHIDTLGGRERMARLQKDLYFQNLPIHASLYPLLNQCRSKTPEPGIAGKFPFSESLQQGKRVADVLDRNPAFLKSCVEVLQTIGGEDISL